jgi:hypothetical protein
MTTLLPVIPLQNPENKRSVDYLQSVADVQNFDYPPVSCLSDEISNSCLYAWSFSLFPAFFMYVKEAFRTESLNATHDYSMFFYYNLEKIIVFHPIFQLS